jgi:proteasome accessory factor B
MQELELDILYRKPNAKVAERRRVQPYHLANRDNSWYLVAHDLSRNDLRNFAVSRIESAWVTNRKFKRPASFSAEQHYARSFGAFVGKGDYRVVVRFGASIAARIKERLWHETLEMKDLPDGRLEFTLRLDSLDEFQRWILGWGPDAEVMEPAELRDRLREAVAKLVRIYPPRQRMSQP